VLVLGLATAATAAEPGPTLQLSRYWSPGAGARLLALSGTVPVAKPGEEIAILAKECSANAFRTIAGAQTDAQGRWFVDDVWGVANGTYRARWNDRLSNTVREKNLPLRFAVRKLRPGRTWAVTAFTVAGHDMSRRRVVLQRQRGASWVTLRTTRLGFGGRPWSFSARFSIPARGLTVRVLFPAATGAPCFDAAATAPWRT
jgi:hypothetical protein